MDKNQKFIRILDLPVLLSKKSFFLLGPRATGKTTLIRETLPESDYPLINLLESETRLRLLHNPSDLRRMITHKNPKAVVIDEIQKIPDLLNEVHHLIESEKMKFLLTGSSARKIKQEGSNLLAGRARMTHLFPLVFPEIPNFKQEDYLHLGGLPIVRTSDEPWQDLRAYVDTYLKIEIEQESQVRNLGQFVRFLYGAALHNGDLLNYAAVANDSMVSESTVRGYYQILVDTLTGVILEPYIDSKKRKAIQTAKFYFFDTGITHAILNLKTLDRASSQYGKALEQWLCMELRAYLCYRRRDESLRFWRTVNGQEVDFIVGDSIGIELKAKNRIQPRDLSGLKALQEEKGFKKFYLVSNDPLPQKIGSIQCMSFESFLEKLWSDTVIE